MAGIRCGLGLVGWMTICSMLGGGDKNASKKDIADEKSKLAPLQGFIGDWKGVGQLRRGSNRGAWIEKSQWSWKFAGKTADNPKPLLAFEAPKGKYFRSGQLKVETDDVYRLSAKTPDERVVHYTGRLADSKLVLSAEHLQAELPARISLRLIARGDRLIILYERKSTVGDRFVRLAEVGYTRQGGNFGKGVSYIECVVTGGKGTIPVTHKGETYYVCCTGCRDFFNEDPQGVLDEYFAKKKQATEQQAEKKQTP